MGLKKTDILSDPVVRDTVERFTQAVRENYASISEEFLRPRIDEIPPLQVLVETDALDSVTAAVLLTEQYSSLVDAANVPDLDPEVAAALRALRDPRVEERGPEALITLGNPVATRIAVAAVASMASGPAFEEMKAEADPVELRMMMAEAGGMLGDMAETLTETGAWKDLPPALLDRYIGGLENLAEISTSRAQKRVMTEIIQGLKTEIAKGSAAEIASAAPQIDPGSKFEQLKDQARRLRPN